MGAMNTKAGITTQHATFVIERRFDATPAQVYKAWADPRAKARWFVGPTEWEKSDLALDFRVGGRESVSGGPEGGPKHYYNATYQDIVPNERIIYSYDMHLDDRRISVSLATVEFKAEGQGTKLVFTEQAAYLEGTDGPALREEGTRGLLEQLDAEVRRSLMQ